MTRCINLRHLSNPAVVTTCAQNCIVFTCTADDDSDQPEYRPQFDFVAGQSQSQSQ